MKDRIRQIMENLHMNQGAFAAFIGAPPATISSIYTGRTRPTLTIVESIKQRVPNVSLDWLMFGRGSMYDTEAGDSTLPAHGQQELNFTGNDTSSASDLNSKYKVPGAQQRAEEYLDFTDEQQRSTPYPNVPRRQQDIVRLDMKNLDKPQRKIKEIRIFFDDGTYESFESKK